MLDKMEDSVRAELLEMAVQNANLRGDTAIGINGSVRVVGARTLELLDKRGVRYEIYVFDSLGDVFTIPITL